ncbi:MAG: membrane protein insertase YidC [Stellaceae bacterium]
MDQNRNVILALVISFAILFGWQLLLPSKPKPPQPLPQQSEQQSQPGTPAPGTAPGTVAAAETAKPRDEVLAETPRVEIRTPKVSGSIDLIGARLDDLTLLDYNETADPKSPKIELLSPDGSEHPYYADFGWTPPEGSAVKLPGPETRWTASGKLLTPQQPVDLTWDNGVGLRFKRRYAIDDNYMFTVTQTVENSSGQPVSLSAFGRIVRVGEPPASATYLLHEGPLAVLNGTLHDGGWWASPDKYNYSDVKKGPVIDTTTGGWLGFTDKYWLTALIPAQQAPVTTKVRYNGEGHRDVFQADFYGSEQLVPAHGALSTEDRFFAGAKEVHLLDYYESALAIPRFDRAIDFGLFYWITKPIFLALDFFSTRIFYDASGSFGLSILLLTLCIKGLFFPLANKSYRAMGKMKALQPEMQKLRERFGEDKARLNQEMMALYKRVGANPMAGCLPIFIQIPVFFSLYKVLYVTIEMRHAPFYGWIRDLSAPDPTSFANLFGLLHFTPPSILMIGAWPLIMGVTMFLQQKLNPAPPDPMQAKMFMALPFVFTYMLAQFASGLVIYWAWNNLLSITQQWLIMRQAGVTRAKPVKT